MQTILRNLHRTYWRGGGSSLLRNSRSGYALNFLAAFSAVGIYLAIGAARPVLSAPINSESPTTTPSGAKDARAPLLVPTQFPTIQAAVNAADTRDTIRILAGTYVEQVTIDKDLRLLGSGADSTIIKAPGHLRAGSFGRPVIVGIKNGAEVTISRLTVTGPGSGSCISGSLSAGILVVEGATLNLRSAAVTHIHDTPIADCFLFGVAIKMGNRPSLTTGHATISDVIIGDPRWQQCSL